MSSMFLEFDEINNILRNDSDLWKLIYYRSTHYYDNPLDKDDILLLPPDQKNEIINMRLKPSPVTQDLVKEAICRIIFHPATRRPQSQSYAVATQFVDFDIFVHHSFNDADMRLTKICDQINGIFNHKHFRGLGKFKFEGGNPFTFEGEYVGYTLTYSFGSVNSK
ncbi:hypothetical protein [Oceanobacillus oncorhynchi]|uniref:hypothetical protein n=1 Tax=Oceanobacillus oncorhynchi TaxID=545501 RepID=UPI0034D44653